MAKISKGSQFVNVRSGSIIEVVTTDNSGISTVVTVNADGSKTNQRRMRDNNIHVDPHTKSGAPWKTGYIPLKEAEKMSKEHAMATDDITDEIPDFSSMDDVALSAWIAKKEALAKALAEEAELGKVALRERTHQAGTRIFGDTAVIAKANRRFNELLAKTVLTPEQYNAICVNKPDPVIAKRVLGVESDAYQACLKESKGGWSLTVRPATDADYKAAEKEAEIRKRAEMAAVFEEGGPIPETAAL